MQITKILLVTLRPMPSCFKRKSAAGGLIQLLFPVTACVCCYGRVWPPRFLLPRRSSLASDQIELSRAERAKGQNDLWSQVEEVRHGSGCQLLKPSAWWTINFLLVARGNWRGSPNFVILTLAECRSLTLLKLPSNRSPNSTNTRPPAHPHPPNFN